jgi:hypothetical protein
MGLVITKEIPGFVWLILELHHMDFNTIGSVLDGQIPKGVEMSPDVQ